MQKFTIHEKCTYAKYTIENGKQTAHLRWALHNPKGGGKSFIISAAKVTSLESEA